ncbi:MAG: T9SS type A sorting domain-containing protein [Melioribacteraceae bacterium]|jgi:hypothetical protein|nr:T9SS type A sorting domain-containing protein [Melioribacteraceae bacterium]
MNNLKSIVLLSLVMLVSVTFGNSKKQNYLTNANSAKSNEHIQKSIVKQFSQLLNPVFSDSESMLDSAIVTKEDGTKERHIYTYTDESFNNWATYLWQNWDGSNWINFMYMTYTFDSNGNFTEGFGQQWQDSSWKDYLKYSSTYNSENLVTSFKSEIWDGATWKTVDKSDISYDGNTSIDISEGSFFGYSYKTKETTTYDLNDNIMSELIEEDNGGTWVNSELITYEYNSDNNKIYEQLNTWNVNDEWQNEFETTYTYDSSKNRIEEESKMWYESDWQNDMKTSITFDSNNYMVMNLTSFWNGSDWDDYNRFSYNYSEGGNSFHGLSEEWDGGLESWVAIEGEFHFFDTKGWYTDFGTHGQPYLFDGTEIDAYFATVTDVETNDLKLSNFSMSQNYPNPFNPSTTINFSIPQQANVKLSVYSSIGEEVVKLLNENISGGVHHITFDATNLSSGIYFYKISVGNFTDVKKMLLLK